MDKRRALAALGLAVAMTLFASNFIVTRSAVLTGFDRYDLVLLRYGPAAILFAPFARPWRTLGGLGLGRGLAVAVLGGALYNFGSVIALHYTPASHGVVLNPGVTMVSTQAFAWMMFAARPSRLSLAGTIVIILGLVAFTGSAAGGGSEPDAWIGDALFVGTGVMWGLYTCLVRRWTIDPLRATAVMSMLSLPPLLVIAAFHGVTLGRLPTATVFWQGMFQVFGVAGGAIILYSRSASILGPALTSFGPPTVPVIGTVMAAVWLAEPVPAGRVAAMAVVLLGMVLGALGQRAASADTAAAASPAAAILPQASRPAR